MTTKQRLSVTVDPELLEAVGNAIGEGKAATVSAWVNDALRMKLEHERRLTAMAAYLEEYEARHGEITPDEMSLAARRARSRTLVVRGSARARRKAG